MSDLSELYGPSPDSELGLALFGLLLVLFLVVAFIPWAKARAAAIRADEAKARYEQLTAKSPNFGWTGTPMWAEIMRKVPPLYGEAALRVLGEPSVANLAIRDEFREFDPALNDWRPVVHVGFGPPGTEPEPEATPEPTPHTDVFFKPGEPTTLADYEGQEHVTGYLAAVIDSMEPEEVMPKEHQLFLGPPGLGKTLLARCFVSTLNQRNARLGLPLVTFSEQFPADFVEPKALDDAIRAASERPTVIFIDEIHDMTDRHTLKLYGLMEDGRYKFEGDEAPTDVPDVLVLGATTDYGKLHPALKRRFNVHMLEPISKGKLRDIVLTRGFSITPEATDAIVARTYFSGAPWEALQLYRQAVAFAKARGSDHVALPDVERVFDTQRIDDLGLRWVDRRVLKMLIQHPRHRRARSGEQEFVCYAASETDVCGMAQLDRGEYRDSVKPRLMARGLLCVRPTYGQSLTEAGTRLAERASI